MLRKNVKSLLEQLQVCIFAEIVFGVRCTLMFIIKALLIRNLSKKLEGKFLQLHFPQLLCEYPVSKGAFDWDIPE